MGEARPELAGEAARSPLASRDILVHLGRETASRKGVAHYIGALGL
jgi:hypothetical protein